MTTKGLIPDVVIFMNLDLKMEELWQYEAKITCHISNTAVTNLISNLGLYCFINQIHDTKRIPIHIVTKENYDVVRYRKIGDKDWIDPILPLYIGDVPDLALQFCQPQMFHLMCWHILAKTLIIVSNKPLTTIDGLPATNYEVKITKRMIADAMDDIILRDLNSLIAEYSVPALHAIDGVWIYYASWFSADHRVIDAPVGTKYQWCTLP